MLKDYLGKEDAAKNVLHQGAQALNFLLDTTLVWLVLLNPMVV